MRPANLDTLGLGAALQELREAWQERTGVVCVLRFEGDIAALGAAVDLTIYRIVQEALTNVARHARACNVRVALSRSSAMEVVLHVQDDGQGMDPHLATRGLGLLGAVERAAAVCGELQVRSAPGQGLTIASRTPLSLPEGPPATPPAATHPSVDWASKEAA